MASFAKILTKHHSCCSVFLLQKWESFLSEVYLSIVQLVCFFRLADPFYKGFEGLFKKSFNRVIWIFTVGVTRKTRIIDVVYNATSNELVRTKTLVKNCIVQIDSTPFKQWLVQIRRFIVLSILCRFQYNASMFCDSSYS